MPCNTSRSIMRSPVNGAFLITIFLNSQKNPRFIGYLFGLPGEEILPKLCKMKDQLATLILESDCKN